MPESITTALIAAAGTVVGAGIPPILSIVKERKLFHLSSRRDAMAGQWEGDGNDIYVAGDVSKIPFKIHVQIKMRGRRASGLATLSAERAPRQELKLEGGFYNEDILQMIYVSSQPGRKQFGVVVFELNAEGTEITGHYAGYSPVRSCFVSGWAKAKKA